MLFYPTFVKSLFAKKKDILIIESPVSDVTMQIREIRTQMTIVQSRFDLETNFDLVDSNIHEMDSLEKRYTYLIKEAKRIRRSELDAAEQFLQNEENAIV